MTIKAHMNPATGKVEYTAIGSSIKASDGNRVSGYLVRFTDADDTDLQGEFFDNRTNFWMREHSPIGKPIMIDHAFDTKFKSVPVGLIDFAKQDEIGIWIEGKLKDRADYEDMLRGWKDRKWIDVDDDVITKAADGITQAVKTFFSTGKAQWSSGALPQSVEVDSETGHIKSWAFIEGTGVYTPAEPDGTEIKLKSVFSTLDEILNSQQADSPIGRKGGNGHKGDTGANADTEAAQPKAQPIVKPTPKVEKPKMTLNIKTIKNRYRETVRAELDAMVEEELSAIVEQIAAEVGAEVSPADADQIAADVGGDIEAAVEATADEDAMMMADDELEADDKRKAVRSIVSKHFYNAAYAKCYAHFGAKTAAKAKAKSDAQAQARHNHLKAQPSAERLPAFTGGAPRISVGENLKYAHLSPSDMALGILMRTAAYKSQGMNVHIGGVVSEDYIRTMTHKMVSHADSMPYGKSAKSATALELANKANFHLKNVMPFKANELDASTLTGQGDEWVGEWWSTDLWERDRMIRHYDTMVSKGMWVQTIEKGAETAYFPTEGSDPVAYVAPQAFSTDATGRPETTININPFGTGRVSVTPKEIKIATAFTTILEEDSIINVVQTVNRQLNEAMLETRDKLMVNGDTETGTTNINYDGATPPTGLSTPYYIASNGFRKTGLANGRDAGNVLNLAQYRLTLAELDPELRQYYERMVFMVDPGTEMASLAIAEIATEDVRRTNATVVSGRLINLHGVDVLVNGFLPSTDTDGKVTASGNVAERGTINLVYAPYWGVAYKRQITLETARDIYSGSNVYVMSMRVAFVPRGANAAAMSYNVATTAS